MNPVETPRCLDQDFIELSSYFLFRDGLNMFLPVREIDLVELQDFCVALGTDLATFTQEYQEELRRQT